VFHLRSEQEKFSKKKKGSLACIRRSFDRIMLYSMSAGSIIGGGVGAAVALVIVVVEQLKKSVFFWKMLMNNCVSTPCFIPFPSFMLFYCEKRETIISKQFECL